MSDEITSVVADAPAPMAAEPIADTPATAVETTAAPATPEVAAAVEDKPATLRDELEKAFDKAEGTDKARDASGRFVSANGEPTAPSEAASDEPAPITDDQPKAEGSEQAATPAIAAPLSWSREAKETWTELPPATQEYIAKRESEAHSQITQLGQQARQFEPFAQILEQYKGDFSRHNVEPAQGFAAMLNVQRLLDENPYDGLRQIAEAYHADLSVFSNQAEGYESSTTPEMAGLLHQVQTLQAELHNIKQSETSRSERENQAYEQTVASEIDTFLSTRQVDEQQMSDMAEYVGYLTQSNPNLSPKDKLETAYKRVVEHNPAVIEARLKQQAATEAAKKAEDGRLKISAAKKAASLNVKGSPATNAPRQFKGLREELEYAYDSRAS